MKFIKGMLIGGIVTAGVAMVYAETMGQNKKKMIRMYQEIFWKKSIFNGLKIIKKEEKYSGLTVKDIL